MQRIRRGRRAVIASNAAVAVCVAGTAFAQDVCGPLVSNPRFPNTTIVSAGAIGADAEQRLPAFCEVHATIAPVEGSRIGAVYRLPENWNGKVLGIGGGGFAGNVDIDSAALGLSRGYAVIQNDLGHPSAKALDPSFAIDANGNPNREAIVDFGHRATHLATLIGKDVATRLYGRAPEHAYWQGCSTGGRQGLAEVQRYPDDYDGVIAGAPVYTPLVYSNAMLRVQAFHAQPGSNLLPAQVPLIRQAVLAACDLDDGVADGILTDPRTCAWDPSELQCASAAAANCLTPAQVATVRRVYSGVATRNGRFAALPLMRGGESDWVTRMIGNPSMPLGLNALLGAPFMSYIVKVDSSYDILSFDPERDMAALDGGIAAAHVHQQNADISPFVSRGGKLLLWHGFNDPGPSPLSSIEYFENVLRRVPAAQDSVRLFLAPGVLHCRGGAGPDQFDALTALEQWVEHGVAPATLIATKANEPLSRPLCPYPALPRYQGAGDPNDAANFECAAR
jgi:feruloyl esterase